MKTIIIADIIIIVGSIIVNSIALTLKSVYESLITILVGKFIVGVGGSGIATVVIPKFSK